MSQVKIGPKFFANELRVYRDWVTAFWRENIQNSFDAGADRIDITIRNGSTPDTKVVVISDNGSGMDRNVLENVYFTLGETTKSGNSVGGFGKARILTCFAQNGYTLHTHNLLVSGFGAEYSIDEINFNHRGVKLEIEVFHKGHDLEAPLKQYLKYCHLDGSHITVNGVRHTDWMYRNKFERRLSFGAIYTNKSKEAGVLVRVNGVHMFKPYTSAPFLIIIEIDKERSREVLQASRDGLLSDFQNELESFINELNINKQSALRQKRSKSIKYNGTGTFKAKRSKGMTPEQVADAFETLLADNNVTVQDNGAIRKMIVEAKNPEAAAEAMKKHMAEKGTVLKEREPVITQGVLHSSGYEVDEEQRQLDLELFNVIVEDETTNPKVRKVIESYYPHNWDLLGVVGSRFDKRYGKRVSFRAGVEKYKLLVLWKAACEFALRLLQDELQIGSDSIAWGVGWCFTDPTTGDKAAAMFKYDDGINWLMLNPCNTDGTMRLKLSDKADLIRIIGSAVHEVCHIVIRDHDERFANLLNDLLDLTAIHQSAMLSFMKQCKDESVERLDRLVAA